MIPIPEELAKRVLEALERGVFYAEREVEYAFSFGGQLHPSTVIVKRQAEEATHIRDELAALLTPKEAT